MAIADAVFSRSASHHGGFYVYKHRRDEIICLSNGHAAEWRNCRNIFSFGISRYFRIFRRRIFSSRPFHSAGCLYSFWLNGCRLLYGACSARLLANVKWRPSSHPLLFYLFIFFCRRRRSLESR